MIDWHQAFDNRSITISSQSNDSGNIGPNEERFKFIDDTSLLEILNLITCGNFLKHVSSDIPVEGQFLPSQNGRSPQILDSIVKSTDETKNETECIKN